MTIFEIHKEFEEISLNKIVKNTDFDENIQMYVFTHSYLGEDSVLDVCNKLPYNDFKIILDFSLYDFPIILDDFLKIKDLSDNFFIISCNWRLVEYDNHVFFDPKIYKFDTENYSFEDEAKSISLIFEKNLGYIKPKKFINLTNHIRRERVNMLDMLYSYKNEGYISFPNPNEISNEVLNFDESIGGWEDTHELIKKSSFIEDLPIRFDLKKSNNNNNEHINDKYSIDYSQNTIYRNSLVNVGLEFNYGMYLTSYLDIFSETTYSKKWENTSYCTGLIHSSEKTLNPLWAHLPLTCLDSKDKLLYMKKYGFSFDCPLNTPSWIDEMYPSDEKTYEFLKFVKTIVEKDIEEIHDIYIQYFNEYQHNFKIMTTKLTTEFVKQKIKIWLENTYQH